MTQAANLTLLKSDGTTTITYTVISSQIGHTIWRESGAANLEAAIKITAQTLPVKRGRKEMRKRVSYLIPVMETATGANSSGYTAGPKVAFAISGNYDFTTNPRATEAQNTEATVLMYRLLASGVTQIWNFLTKDESIT